LQFATNNPYKGREADTNNMKKLTLVQTLSVNEGTIANPTSEFNIPLDKGIDSALNKLVHSIHKLGTAFKLSQSKGMSVAFHVRVDDTDTSVVISSREGLVIKEKSSEAYLKEAGLKKITLKDFTVDFTVFSLTLPAIVNVFKYHLGAYMDADSRAESYKSTAKTYFQRDLKEGKSDLASWSVQTKSATETVLYALQDMMSAAKAENTNDYLEQRRESARLAIEFKKEQRKQLAAAKK
jgi:hypothetical protein